MLDQQKTMTAEEKKELDDILNKANSLLEGGYIGRDGQLGVRRFPVTESDK
jgi:hypothetical protein